MARRPNEPPFDRELADLPPAARWREWMSRVEAVVFAAPTPVPRAVLAQLVGEGCPLDAVIADIRAELRDRPYDLMPVAGGWHHHTRPHLAPVLHAARNVTGAPNTVLSLNAADGLLLATIAYHQPVTRRDLEWLLGRAVDADAVARLRAGGLVGPGPRSPRPGAPLTYVTTDAFLDTFGLESLADLPELEDLRAMGLADTTALDGTPTGSPAPSGPLPFPLRSPARPVSPATDLTTPLADVAAVSARVGALLESLTDRGEDDGSGGCAPGLDR